ncbi:MAG: isoprenylcysteine carboxylmethyltransferase family protein [Theionarchaea archaeon]|nr:MAG: hypothetical protein AYK18_04230 [Theionarchaea archaeon DG-70]MBU7012852.1 isoprenylcysteine carboxylmethyltransferase family protein [Theionarchaea archaeon]
MLTISQIVLLVSLLIYIGLFGVSLIIPKRAGYNPKGTTRGYTKEKIVLSNSSILLILVIVLYVVTEQSINWFWKFPFLATPFFQWVGTVVMGTGLILEAVVMGTGLILEAVVMGTGLILEAVGIVTLGVNFRVMLPQEKTNLVTHGIYSYVRHPMVLSVMLFAAGIFFIVPNGLTLFNAVVQVVMYNAKADVEEQYLLQVHGENYRTYKKRVGKFFPKLQAN